MKILDPDNYNSTDFNIGEKIKIKDNGILKEAIITDIDYKTDSMSVEYLKTEKNDKNKK